MYLTYPIACPPFYLGNLCYITFQVVRKCEVLIVSTGVGLFVFGSPMYIGDLVFLCPIFHTFFLNEHIIPSYGEMDLISLRCTLCALNFCCHILCGGFWIPYGLTHAACVLRLVFWIPNWTVVHVMIKPIGGAALALVLRNSGTQRGCCPFRTFMISK